MFVLVVHVDNVATDAVDGAALALCTRDKERPQVWFWLWLVLADEDEGEFLFRVDRDPFFGALDTVERGLAWVVWRGILPAAINGEDVIF